MDNIEKIHSRYSKLKLLGINIILDPFNQFFLVHLINLVFLHLIYIIVFILLYLE